MASLETLKNALRHAAKDMPLAPTVPLTETQYSAGFEFFTQGSGWKVYEQFIIPQLSKIFDSFGKSTHGLSVLEIGPGPKSALGYLSQQQRCKIGKYTAMEPNRLFAWKLEKCLSEGIYGRLPFPDLEDLPAVYRVAFGLDSKQNHDALGEGAESFNLILFCHSMYGMKCKDQVIDRALELLVKLPQDGLVAVFHRDNVLQLSGLAYHPWSKFPTGTVSVENSNEALNDFAPFIAGFDIHDSGAKKAAQSEWRVVCRARGRCEGIDGERLVFSAPEIMMAFTRHARALSELTKQVPVSTADNVAKIREARSHRPASIVRPENVDHVQQCVKWALKHRVSLTVVSGGHSGHCLWSNVVAVDMTAFKKAGVLFPSPPGETLNEQGPSELNTGQVVIAESGCMAEDIIYHAQRAGVTVPLGSRPSVGSGLWLQGGIGHLTRLYGLSSDAIVGAVMVTLASAQVHYVGNVPESHRPAGATRPTNENELLWGIKGAGTNVGIVISVTFKAFPAPKCSLHNWVLPLSSEAGASHKLKEFNELIAQKLPRHRSADAYLYADADQLQLGVTVFDAETESSNRDVGENSALDSVLSTARQLWGLEKSSKAVDTMDLFNGDLYISEMHGGHGGGKTSSFKRCLFLKDIGGPTSIAEILAAAVQSRPSPFSYIHLLQGGGAASDVQPHATAFGCRDWNFACVVTGVWPRHQDETEMARRAVDWVYQVANRLLPLSAGVYGADLGPDPRDAPLAARAFGHNVFRLAQLKHKLDPHHVLAHACPLPKASPHPKLIVLVTGEYGAGKDYCADVWLSTFKETFTTRLCGISNVLKREYATATGADFTRLLGDRAYKEEHRPAMTEFFEAQVQERPQLCEENFMNVVHNAKGVDVLFITGMRDVAPVATFSPLVPASKLLEVRVSASEEKLEARRIWHCSRDHDPNLDADSRPDLVLDNDTDGNEAAMRFSECHLLPLLHTNLQSLVTLIRPVSDFPRRGIEFRHVLDIVQQEGGLGLSTSLLWEYCGVTPHGMDALVCCEAGGFVFASAMAADRGLPLVLVREAGKLPPPTVSVVKSSSHVSSSSSDKLVEMNRNAISEGGSVLVVDDVLATGNTLCAVLELMGKAGVNVEDISVVVVAEFPIHRGRQLLRQRGFGRVRVNSLLVFGSV